MRQHVLTQREALGLQQYQAQGQKATLLLAFETISRAFIHINGGRGEDMHAMFNGLLSTPSTNTACTMVAQARAPFADRNGREFPAPPGEDSIKEMKKIIADLRNQVVQCQANLTADKHKRIRTANCDKKRARDGEASTAESGAAKEKLPTLQLRKPGRFISWQPWASCSAPTVCPMLNQNRKQKWMWSRPWPGSIAYECTARAEQ